MEPRGVQQNLSDGRYRLHRVLGVGGCAAVYQATDGDLGVERAIKVLTLQGQSRATSRRRLRAEARAMARLNHPNVLRVFDIGKEGQVDFVVMELAEGGSLQEKVERHGALSTLEASRLMVQVLSALQAAHAMGVVHRDVKPQNILLTADGRALLADFGIAMVTDDSAMRRTRTNVAMGSMAFMAPEQRLDARSVGPTADVYSAGCTLYALVTAGNPVDLFAARPDSPRWEAVPLVLREIVQRAVAQDPADRYADARAFALALLEVIGALAPEPVHRAVLTHDRDATPAPSLPDTARSAADATHHAVDLMLRGDVGGEESGATLVAPDLFDADEEAEEESVDSGGVLAFPGLPVVPTEQWKAEAVEGERRRRSGLLAGVALLVAAVVLALGLAAWIVTREMGPTEADRRVEIISGIVAEAPVVERSPEPPTTSSVAPGAEPVRSPTAVSRPRASPPPSGPAAGTWSVNVLGRPGTLELRGSKGALTGTLTMTNGQRSVSTEVAGSIDAAGTLRLAETGGAADAAEFEVDLGDRDRAQGTMRRRNGTQHGPFLMTRTR